MHEEKHLFGKTFYNSLSYKYLCNKTQRLGGKLPFDGYVALFSTKKNLCELCVFVGNLFFIYQCHRMASHQCRSFGSQP
jgi:hypothetical protein